MLIINTQRRASGQEARLLFFRASYFSFFDSRSTDCFSIFGVRSKKLKNNGERKQ